MDPGEALRSVRARELADALTVDGMPEPAPGRIGLLAGSFDPPTTGHVSLAEAGLRSGLGVVILVYSVATLPKEPGAEPPLLTEDARVRALSRLARRPGLAWGLTSSGLLVDQVAGARRRWPTADLTVLLGSDKVLQLLDPRWYADRDAALDRLVAEADVRFAARSGAEDLVTSLLARPQHERWAGRFTRLRVAAEVAAISSGEVRRRHRRGEDIMALVPPEVLPLPATGP